MRSHPSAVQSRPVRYPRPLVTPGKGLRGVNIPPVPLESCVNRRWSVSSETATSRRIGYVVIARNSFRTYRRGRDRRVFSPRLGSILDRSTLASEQWRAERLIFYFFDILIIDDFLRLSRLATTPDERWSDQSICFDTHVPFHFSLGVIASKTFSLVRRYGP